MRSNTKRLIVTDDHIQQKREELQNSMPQVNSQGKNVIKPRAVPDVVINVPSVPYPTIQSAINSADDPTKYVEINIAPGIYYENLNIGAIRTGVNIETRNYSIGDVKEGETLRGLQINGDNRPYLPTYANGYEFSSNTGKLQNATVTTNDPLAPGPYDLLIASFGPQPLGIQGPFGVEVASPLRACGTVSNSFGGKVALVKRGSCAFVNKTQNVQDAGASIALIYNSSPTGGIVSMGGTNSGLTIPSYGISFADGTLLEARISANPGIQLTFQNPATLYFPPLGTNYGTVKLSQIGTNQVKVEITDPIPIVDPNLPRGVTPLIEQPNFNSSILGFVPGDTIILNECNWTDNNIWNNFTGYGEYTITAINGNILTVSPPLDNSVVDVSRPGCSLTFMPNVRVIPNEVSKPNIRANGVGFGMNGIWTYANPALPARSSGGGVYLENCDAYLSNMVFTDADLLTGGSSFVFYNSSVVIGDGWRNDATNRHIISFGEEMIISNSTVTGGDIISYGNNNFGGLAIQDNSYVHPNSLIVMGNPGLYIPNEPGLVVTSSQLRIDAMFVVTDIYGTGIQASDSTIYLGGGPNFRLERITFPIGSLKTTAGMFLQGSNLALGKSNRYTDLEDYTFRIREKCSIKDCRDFSAELGVTGFTGQNVGIIVDSGTFGTDDDIDFQNNDIDYLTFLNGKMDTRKFYKTPENVLQVETSGTLDPSYEFQRLGPGASTITFDPSATYLFENLYIGKTFTLISDTDSTHCFKLDSGKFIGACKGTVAKFLAVAGSSITFRILDAETVFVLGSFGVLPSSAGSC